jgi:hypothetical protein
MNKIAFIILTLLSPLTAKAQLADNIPEYSRQVINAIGRGAESCGMRIVTSPPNRPTPADYVVLNNRGVIVAHVLDRGGVYEVKHPLGGNVHWIEYSWEWFKVATPQGTVAHANRYTTGNGWQYNYYCRSTFVNANQFDSCIRSGFTAVVVQRLCATNQ